MVLHFCWQFHELEFVCSLGIFEIFDFLFYPLRTRVLSLPDLQQRTSKCTFHLSFCVVAVISFGFRPMYVLVLLLVPMCLLLHDTRVCASCSFNVTCTVTGTCTGRVLKG